MQNRTLQPPHQTGFPPRRPREIYSEMRDQVRLAEEVGFDAAWFHRAPLLQLLPQPLAAHDGDPGWRGQTTRIKLGTAVVVTPLLRALADARGHRGARFS